jgi:hypothetical protein
VVRKHARDGGPVRPAVVFEVPHLCS